MADRERVTRRCVANACPLCSASLVSVEEEHEEGRTDNKTPVVLVFGGTFLPPHANHARLLLSAKAALERFPGAYSRPRKKGDKGTKGLETKEFGFRVLGAVVLAGHALATERKFGSRAK
jgi:hypothetical protein